MRLDKFLRLGSITLLLSCIFCLNVSANEIMSEIDTLRAELSCTKDKNSPYYQKTKDKLDKLIKKNKLDYSQESRLLDIQRLIDEQKYNSATYELNELIKEGYQISKCNELLGDINLKCENTPKKIAQFYKLALQYDKDNYNASYKLAKLYFREKKNIIAIEYLKQTINTTNDCELLEEIKNIVLNKIKPQSAYEANNLYEVLGNIYQKLGAKESSYEAYSKAIAINQNDLYLKYHLSGLLFDDNQNNYAISLFDSILKENPKDLQIKHLKAKALAKNGQIELAYAQYLEILKQFPKSNQARYGIYKIYENKLNPSEIYKKVYQKKESYSPKIAELKQFALFLKEMEDIKGFEDYSLYVNNLEKIEQEKLALQDLKKETVLEQKLNPPVKNQIKQKTEKKKPKKEVKKKTEEKKSITKKETQKQEIKNIDSKKIKEQEQKAIEQERKNAIAKNASKYNELKAIADKYLSLSPKTAQNYIAAANTYKQMGEPTSAIKYYKEAMKLDPTNSDIYYNLGLTSFEMNKTEEAKNYLAKSINLEPENLKAKNLLSFVNQKNITHIINKAYDLYEKKNYVSAFEILDNGLKEYPNNGQMHYYRALIFSAMNRNAAAIIDLQKALEFDPSQYMAYYELGKLYEKIKDERSALVAYEKFLSIEPEEKELIDEIQKKVITLGAKYY